VVFGGGWEKKVTGDDMNSYGSTRSGVLLSCFLDELIAVDRKRGRFVLRKVSSFLQGYFTALRKIREAFKDDFLFRASMVQMLARDAEERIKFLSVPDIISQMLHSVVRSQGKDERRRANIERCTSVKRISRKKQAMLDAQTKHKKRYDEACESPRKVFLQLKARLEAEKAV
jgi:hypothetical protein